MGPVPVHEVKGVQEVDEVQEGSGPSRDVAPPDARAVPALVPSLVPALVHLVRKLQGILAAIERLPVQSCVGPHSLVGLDALKRPLRLQLQRAPGEDGLIELGGKVVKAEPLVTVQALEQFLLTLVEPKWHDLPRSKLQ
ncbi:hypothetical protein T484DRAFT_1804547 [Baffinella frigidus]|nr:hypothetical protein T484DRAFT_1804547 [Cryptophyta sp. CCMP2293]